MPHPPRHVALGYIRVSSISGGTCVFTNTLDLWDPLVQTAAAQYEAVQDAGGGTRGYFGQILNIVCRRTQSAVVRCTLVEHAGADRTRALRRQRSGPAGRVHPQVSELRINLSTTAGNDSTRELADVVVTMGCGETCPYIPYKHCVDY